MNLNFSQLLSVFMKLILNDLFNTRNVSFGKRLLESFLKSTDFLTITRGGKTIRITCFSRSSGTPTPVIVSFRIVWHLVVDDMGNVINVYTSGSYIGSNKNLQLALSKTS